MILMKRNRQPKGSKIFAASVSKDRLVGGNEAENSVTLLRSKKNQSLLVSQLIPRTLVLLSPSLYGKPMANRVKVSESSTTWCLMSGPFVTPSNCAISLRTVGSFDLHLHRLKPACFILALDLCIILSTSLALSAPHDKSSAYIRCNILYMFIHLCYHTRYSFRTGRIVEHRIFYQSFRKFTARRGLPAKFLSDNAKTFNTTSIEVKTLLRCPKLHAFLTTKGVERTFIPEKSPWEGGIWERLVGSVQFCLVKVIGRAMVSVMELSTILVEIEAVINSRPLTYIYMMILKVFLSL